MHWMDDDDDEDNDDDHFYDDMPEIDLNLEGVYRGLNGPHHNPGDNLFQSDSSELFFICYPASLAGMSHLEYGNHIVLPPLALSRLLLLKVECPMLFEIQNQLGKRVSHCGVREFTAGEGRVFLPDCMMKNLQVKEGDFVSLNNVKLETGSYIKLQPHSSVFFNISNPRVVLKKSLRNFFCLTTGDTFAIDYNNKDYSISVVDTKPYCAVNVINTNCEVDFAPPLNFKEPMPVEETRKEKALTDVKVKFRIIVFRPFVGEVIAGKLKESDVDGLRLSLGFFDDIYIPAHLLPNPSRFVPDPENRYKVRWVWEYSPGEEYNIDGLDEIKFRVHAVNYPPIPLEQPEKPFAPMVITGTVDADGLGPVSWW